MNELARVRMREQKAKASFFHILLNGLTQEGVARFRVVLPTSDDVIKEIPYRHAQLLGI